MSVVLVPIVEGKVGAWRAWAKELIGPRKAEFADFNRRYELTKHQAWFCQTPHGPAVVAIHEGTGAESFMKKLGQSSHDFDVWFRSSLESVHGMKLSGPPPGPMPELVIDS